MKQQLIFVTGASRGIGAAIALELATQGYQVGCLSRSGDLPSAPGTSPEIAARWHAVPCDVTQPDAVRNAMNTVVERLGLPVAGLVNNAGLHTEQPTIDLPAEEFQRLMNMNALSTLQVSQIVYPLLQANGGGLIVNIGSFFDKLGVKRNVAYCASKAAVGAITRCLAVEWAPAGIKVINIAPGYIVTDLNKDAMESDAFKAYLQRRIPGKQPGQARDVGAFVTSLFTTRCDFLTGETIYMDGAQAISA